MNHRFFRSFIILVLFVCLLSSQAVQKMNQLPSMKAEDTTITSVVQASQDEAIQVTSLIIPTPNDVSLPTRMPPMKQVVFSNLMKDYFNNRELYVTDTSRMVESMKYHSNYLSVHAS
ncbi:MULTISPECIES: hypothetical protein [Virgibacillus]|uniref:Uncharacterized protein n=3 Tax=Bacillaceae TaxID=186817 RepID=A0A0L0QWN0_VIRPA|nr:MULTISPECIES: hypothetical protein [Virgibacillus]API92442.1 hypothetical protein BKP57_11775 [Virgibacillus sp. 6R]KNE22608.1 hypothetical protein AFK71_00130 [Virgibacillus pantothenticus]MBS7427307.1 hypothetical protein [Virgibacillus sp. 19R1-5]MBU8567040.1 hypothetical protein [Virgibacillus pantothenticus]MBU8646817.1 hypothetical protein [Virgibacillus pantothenticus]